MELWIRKLMVVRGFNERKTIHDARSAVGQD